MKRIINIVVALFILQACTNSLDLTPQGQEGSDIFLNTEANAINAVNAIYDLLTQTEGPGPDGVWLSHHYDFFMGSIATDDAEPQPGGMPELVQIASFNTAVGNTITEAFWIHGFWAISRANYVITNLPNATIDAQLKKRLLGEAYFMRGYYYMYLLQHFGGVPLLEESVQPSQFGQIPRATIHETLEFIKRDLGIALSSLPERSQYASSDLGRATAGAARAYLARVIMYQIGIDEKGTATWDDVYKQTSAIIASGEYSLVSNYAELFEYENKNSSESIFEVQAIQGSTQNIPASVGTSNSYFQANRNAKGDNVNTGWGFHNPTQNLVDAFDASDPRLSCTVYGIGYNKGILYGSQQNFVRSDQGSNYLNRKSTLPFKPTMGKAAPQNIILMRYADVILMHAEACYHLGKIPESQASLNQVRTRARNSTYCKGYIEGDAEGYVKPQYTPNIPDVTSTGNDLLQAIIHERRIEFALEGYHAWDLIRTGVFPQRVAEVKDTDRINNASGDEIRQVGIEAKITHRSIVGKGGIFIPVFPIPLSEVQNWHLEQNPNY